ncbi:hypothetical protein BGZ79_006886 [Entomortierella chlamydospora]|nr:hypothetical protein BGZ79_006886 [Entomortierella chlamydospora]
MSQQMNEKDWILSADDKSAVAFFKAFNLNDKQSANRRYGRLLKAAPLPRHQKDKLIKEFTAWKLNESAEYWLDSSSEKSAIETAEVLVKGAVPYATRSIIKNTSKLEYINSQELSGDEEYTSEDDSEADDISDVQDQIESESESEDEETSVELAEIDSDERQMLLQMVESSKHDKCEGNHRGVRAINAYRNDDEVFWRRHAETNRRSNYS